MILTLPERIAQTQSVLEEFGRKIKGQIRVSMPCIVTNFDPEKQTVNCIPAIRELINIGSQVKFIQLPELREVPIEIPRAGNYAITLPIKVGQECRVTFQDLCIDSWWVRGGIQNWNDLRRHDLSDAIATFSPWSQPNSIPQYSTESLEIRSLDGTQKVALNKEDIQISMGDSIFSLKNEEIHLQVGGSSLIISSEGILLTGPLIINGKPYLEHLHTGVMAGPGVTGPVSTG